MPIPERYGTLVCGWTVPPDTVFGTPVQPTTWLPMTGADDLAMDPAFFAPALYAGDLPLCDLFDTAPAVADEPTTDTTTARGGIWVSPTS